MPRYVASRTLPAPVGEVWAVLSEPQRFADWWPGLERVDPTVRRGFAPGALWQIEGTDRPSFRLRPQLSGTLLVLEVVTERRLVFQLIHAHVDVELDLEAVPDGETAATLSVEAPRLSGVGRAFPSEVLARLADLVRPTAS